MLGSPYELTRSDMGNPKSVTMLDLQSGEETKFVNNFSPKFKKFLFDQILEMTIEQLEPEFKNNFVDIMIDPKMALKAPLNILTDSISTQRKLGFHPYDPNQANSLSSQIYDTDGRQFSVMDFVKEYVKGMEYDETTKDKLVGSLEKLYKMIVEKDQENRL
jgi:hypothetical protein